jgi:hypothetical protein
MSRAVTVNLSTYGRPLYQPYINLYIQPSPSDLSGLPSARTCRSRIGSDLSGYTVDGLWRSASDEASLWR